MQRDQSPALLNAYRATSYRVGQSRSNQLTVRIGAPYKTSDMLLRRHAAPSAAIVTAWNPRSRLTARPLNPRATARLDVLLGRGRLDAVPVAAIPDDPDWPIEEGRLVLDISSARALALAVLFGQNAIVFLAHGCRPALLTTRLFGEP